VTRKPCKKPCAKCAEPIPADSPFDHCSRCRASFPRCATCHRKPAPGTECAHCAKALAATYSKAEAAEIEKRIRLAEALVRQARAERSAARGLTSWSGILAR
jgi:hypothetical protein